MIPNTSSGSRRAIKLDLRTVSRVLGTALIRAESIGSSPERDGRLLEQADGASWPGSMGQALISGHQLAAQGLGERNVDGVVRCHVRA